MPLFIINNGWDGSIIDYGFSIGDLSGIKNFYFEISSNFQFYIIRFLYFLKIITNLPNELIFDLFTGIFLILFCYEVKRFSEKIFNLDKQHSLFCFIFALIFPVWNSLTEINLGLYLFCFYLAISGYRLFSNTKNIFKFIGIILILLSFSIKSNFAFVLALCLTENFYNYVQKKKINYNSIIIIFSISILGYLVNSFYFPPYGNYSGYNQIELSNLKWNIFIKNIKDYLSFLIYFILAPIFYIIFFKYKFKKKFMILNKDFKLKSLSLFFLMLMIMFPYVLVQKSTDIFNFTNFDSRHVFLLSVPFSIFLAIIIKKIKTEINVKTSNLFICIILLQSVILLTGSYFAKYNYTLIDQNLIKSFQKIKEPSSGYIIISSKKLQRNFYHLNNLAYKAYGKAAWIVLFDNNVDLQKKIEIENFFADYKKIFSKKVYSVKYVFNNMNKNCISVYDLKNEINPNSYFIKNFFINKGKYFKLSKILEKC